MRIGCRSTIELKVKDIHRDLVYKKLRSIYYRIERTYITYDPDPENVRGRSTIELKATSSTTVLPLYVMLTCRSTIELKDW